MGPLRAIALALSTRCTPIPEVSHRATELERLKSMLKTVQRDQYVVVAGPKGIGSCVFIALVNPLLPHILQLT